jgi:hypothetical protein
MHPSSTRQNGGVNNDGTIGTARDIVGRDKIINNFGSGPGEVADEVIRRTDNRRKLTPDISGRWADASGSVFQITQTGDAFSYVSLNQQTGLRTQGTGSLDGHRFNTTYQTNIPSTGTGSGTVTDNGLEIIESIQDSVLGSYAVRAHKL